MTVTSNQIRRQRAKDQATLQALREAGSNLQLPHDIEHHFTASSIEPLEALASVAAKTGYVAEQFDAGSSFSLDLKKSIVPDEQVIFAETARMLSFADQFGVEYDGWGTSVVDGQ